MSILYWPLFCNQWAHKELELLTWYKRSLKSQKKSYLFSVCLFISKLNFYLFTCVHMCLRAFTIYMCLHVFIHCRHRLIQAVLHYVTLCYILLHSFSFLVSWAAPKDLVLGLVYFVPVGSSKVSGWYKLIFMELLENPIVVKIANISWGKNWRVTINVAFDKEIWLCMELKTTYAMYSPLAPIRQRTERKARINLPPTRPWRGPSGWIDLTIP